MKYVVKIEDDLVARFKTKEDAEHFARWKRNQLAKEFSFKQLDEYIKEHPVTKYGSRTLPGDVPLSITYPKYSAYVEKLEKIVIVEEGL